MSVDMWLGVHPLPPAQTDWRLEETSVEDTGLAILLPISPPSSANTCSCLKSLFFRNLSEQ